MAVGWVLWDASGLVKRYLVEIGSDTVDAVFAEAPSTQMAVTPWGYLETYSILRRRFNNGAFDLSAYTDAVTALQTEVVASGEFGLLPISDADVFAAISLIDAHNINSSDAAILSAFLRFRDSLSAGSPTCLLVAADQRLLRAAAAEGLMTLDPERTLPADVPALLTAL